LAGTLVYFEKHVGLSGGLLLCDHVDLAAEFILEKRELLRNQRDNSLGFRAGKSLQKFHVKRRPQLSQQVSTTWVRTSGEAE
jgi:hypothetical protein